MGRQQMDGDVSRKEQRKQNRVAKKQKKADFFSHKPHHQIGLPNNSNTRYSSSVVNKGRRHIRGQQYLQQQNDDEGQELSQEYFQGDQFGTGQGGEEQLDDGQDNFQEQQPMSIEGEGDDGDDALIKFYEQKLKMSEGPDKKLKLILKQNGLEGDFFSFLDDIGKKVKSKTPVKYPNNLDQAKAKLKKLKKTKIEVKATPEPIEQQSEPQWEQKEGDQQLEWQPFSGQQIMQEQEIQQQQKPPTKPSKPKATRQTKQSLSESNQQRLQQQHQIIRKSLNSLLNKVSDGNILKISREVNTVFINNAKNPVFTCFSELFLKSNIQNPKTLIHILAANVALSCGLHHLYDNQFFSKIISKLVATFDQLQKTEETITKNQDDVEINEVLEKKKNCIKIFCYMYMLGSLTIDLMKEMFFELSQDINHSNIQLLYLLVTTVGSKIREDDPKVLKDIIIFVQEQIGLSKNQGYQESNKIRFILNELNELKLNKKCLVDPDHRFNFLATFIKKNVISQNGIVAKVFVPTLKEIRESDQSTPFWWQPTVKHFQEQERTEMKQELTEQARYLQDLARQQKMVTEKKKKIFVSIMKAEDYLQATENILQLKIKSPSQVAEVIVQVCTQEKTFNMFYVHLSNKLIECSVRYKNSFKFAIWSQQSQMENYNFRKISNLAKFMARLIIMSEECSLAFLKNLGDLMNLNKFMQMFLMIVLQELFSHVDLERLGRLITKIRVGDNNKDFKRNLSEYLSEDYYKYCKDNNKDYKDRVRLAVRLLAIEEDEKEEGEREDMDAR